MKPVQVNKFGQDHELITLIWNDKPCWIAKQVAEMAGQLNASSSISCFLKENEFLELPLDYVILTGEDLKYFKQLIQDSCISHKSGFQKSSQEIISPHTRSLTLFYEPALWAYLQSLRSDLGVQLKRWINREVLPQIRSSGAYITSEADPKYLRNVADNIESMKIAYDNCKLFHTLIDEIGLDSRAKLLTAKVIYQKAGIEIPIQIKEQFKIFDTHQIAKRVPLYTKNGNPAYLAVGKIIKKLSLEPNEVQYVWESTGAWQGVVTKYSESVVEKVRNWLAENDFPSEIAYTTRTGKNQVYHICYKDKVIS